ncbi:MAG: ribosome-associated translation inhibitor RaiA [Gammaproteobacteria bacterium]|nr:ribosome-associated translation inhibitor RaiA [Gammaproteobacteria bacterium]MDD9821671.1 ribosome-associated translation inhibitor RaiA [Gammaproteobacteria bacterium]MDD9855820.1 ribosome-associated translation inhibitor RaiA [Gammaproteobacteria bacterium]MDD9883516.1 ribosome-associated translation inhibitor RaiA [Gammaproteobacteria bacterium]
MQLSISGQHMDITDALRGHVADKVEKITRHFDHVTRTHVVLQVEKTRHMAEATVNTKGATLHAAATAGDMYAAIDSMAEKLDRQVIKHKEKLTDHHRGDESLKQPPDRGDG